MRATGMQRARPRAWSRLVEAQSSVLTDAAWIERLVRAPGTIDGTPNYVTASYGGLEGYAAKLSTPTQAERRDTDKWSIESSHTLAIASDVVPQISDQIYVLAPVMLGTSERVLVRVTGEVVSRRTNFGRPLLHHMQVQILRED